MTTATTSTKYASVDPANDDEIARLWLERAIVELAETLGTERLYKGQAEEIADEMSDLPYMTQRDSAHPRAGGRCHCYEWASSRRPSWVWTTSLVDATPALGPTSGARLEVQQDSLDEAEVAEVRRARPSDLITRAVLVDGEFEPASDEMVDDLRAVAHDALEAGSFTVGAGEILSLLARLDAAERRPNVRTVDDGKLTGVAVFIEEPPPRIIPVPYPFPGGWQGSRR